MQNKASNLLISKINFNRKKNYYYANIKSKFLEKRDYIQGVVVLDGMLQCCLAACPKMQNSTYKIEEAKINSEIINETVAYAFNNDKVKNFKKKGEIAYLRLKINNNIIICKLFKKKKKISKNFREKLDIYGKHIIKLSVKNKSTDCKVERINTIIDLIRAIEECHRDVIKLDFKKNKPKNIRWCYLNDLIVKENKLKNIKSFKLIDKKIFKNRKTFFDIRKVKFKRNYTDNKPQFCFNADI